MPEIPFDKTVDSEKFALEVIKQEQEHKKKLGADRLNIEVKHTLYDFQLTELKNKKRSLKKDETGKFSLNNEYRPFD